MTCFESHFPRNMFFFDGGGDAALADRTAGARSSSLIEVAIGTPNARHLLREHPTWLRIRAHPECGSKAVAMSGLKKPINSQMIEEESKPIVGGAGNNEHSERS